MENLLHLFFAVAAFFGIIEIVSLFFRDRRTRNTAQTPPVTQNRKNTAQQSKETGMMVYYANDNHGRRDREYRFNYKREYDPRYGKYCWRAYIIRMPSLCGRSADLHKTHRFRNEHGEHWVCWDRAVDSLRDMQIISRKWADSIQEYIATGKLFG